MLYMPPKVLLIAFVLTLVGCSGSNIRFVEDTTGVSFPEYRKALELRDNGEWCVVGTFETTPAQLQSFVKTYSFESDGQVTLAELPAIFALSTPNQQQPEPFRPRYLRGHTEHNSWMIIADEASSRIWFVVIYPDLGGDAPGPIGLKKDLSLPSAR